MRAILFGLGVAIALMFPVALRFVCFLYSPPPKYEDYQLGINRSSVDTEVGTPAQRKEAEKKQQANMERLQAAQNKNSREVFYGMYPIGLLALVIGAFSRRRALGAGLIFGAIFALIDGCYEAWEVLPGWLSVGSKVLALAIVIVTAAIVEGRMRSAADQIPGST